MTGIMVPPVGRTSKKAIWPVIAEVVVLNLVLVVIVCSLHALPHVEIDVTHDKVLADPHYVPTEQENQLAEHVLEVLARQHVHPAFATVASVIFGLLLLSATNTAIIAMISIQYVMSRDRELPKMFSRVNEFGVPLYALILACTLAAVVTGIAAGLGQGTLQTLAKLYAIGVVGAIVINLGSCAINRKLKIKFLERGGMWAIGGVLAAIWITIATTNTPALVFIIVMLAAGLTLRFIAHRVPAVVPVPAEAVPAAEAVAAAAELPPFDPAKGKILVATRYNVRLLRFAFDEARRRDANLFVLYVRDIAVLFRPEEHPLTPEEDMGAQAMFRAARGLAGEYAVPLQEIYCVSPEPADVILDFAATYAADLVILGVSRRAGVLRALRGDVISGVADNLPAESTLLIHA
jgi:nucleotide-binding universal stress UspA family protein